MWGSFLCDGATLHTLKYIDLEIAFLLYEYLNYWSQVTHLYASVKLDITIPPPMKLRGIYSLRPSVHPTICRQNRVCSITFLLVEGSFSYLLQIFTARRRCVKYIDFSPWSISLRSAAHDFAKNTVKLEVLCISNHGAVGVYSQNASIQMCLVGSDNDLSPIWRQAIIWTNADQLLIRPKGTKFSQILIEIWTVFIHKNAFEFRKCQRWWPFCIYLNMLNLILLGASDWWSEKLHQYICLCIHWFYCVSREPPAIMPSGYTVVLL